MSDTTSSDFVLFRSSDASRFADVRADGLDMLFPEEIHGWSDVLDCRIPPYATRSINENCHFAEHVRKPYILVNSSYVE